MVSPMENQLKPVETGRSNRNNLDPILNQSKTVSGSLDDLDIRADFEKFLDSTIDSTNL